MDRGSPQAGFVAAPRFDHGDDPAVMNSFRERLADVGARRLLDYWLTLVAEHGLSVKALFDPVRVPDLLASLYIEEWDHATAQSRIRMTGERVRTAWGGDGIIGHTVDQQVQGEVNALWKECDRLNFTEQRATLSLYDLTHRNRGHRWLCDLALPMSNASAERFVLGYLWDYDAPGR